MLLGGARSTICVQRLDDSLNSAIHTRYRSLLRSSSMHEPRGPPLEVVSVSTFRAEKQPNDRGEATSQKKNAERGARGRCRLSTTRLLCPSKQIGGTRQSPPNCARGRIELSSHSVMILLQVHLRKPCYDFYCLIDSMFSDGTLAALEPRVQAFSCRI